ncbi:MAG: hypothetical protein WCX73_05985 [Candidatus Pacearchaeota archaeon]
MTVNELIERIEKKLKDIEKRKNLIQKLEKKIETLTGYDLKWAKDDLQTSNDKLKDLEIQLTNLYKQKEKQESKNNIERIPVIEEFLEQWKVKVIEWFKMDYQRLKEYKKELKQKEEELRQWQQENKIYHWGKETKEKEKELGIDYETKTKKLHMFFHSLTLNLIQFGKEWEEQLEKEIEKDKNNKRELLVLRVKKITGKILDASFLHMGVNGEINGYIIGEKGKAKVETITAGGWNIQCYHFRVLVKEIN